VSWFVGAVGAMLVAGAVFLGVVMNSVYERMLGVCFEWIAIRTSSPYRRIGESGKFSFRS
jgi:hypothetical protein